MQSIKVSARHSTFAAAPARADSGRQSHSFFRRRPGRNHHDSGRHQPQPRQESAVQRLSPDVKQHRSPMGPPHPRRRPDHLPHPNPRRYHPPSRRRHYRARDAKTTAGSSKPPSTPAKPGSRSAISKDRTPATASISSLPTSRPPSDPPWSVSAGRERNTTMLMDARIDADYTRAARRIRAGEGDLCVGGKRSGEDRNSHVCKGG